MSILHGNSPSLHAAGPYLDLQKMMTNQTGVLHVEEYLGVAEGGGLLAGDWL
jgi:hypothetical protein